MTQTTDKTEAALAAKTAFREIEKKLLLLTIVSGLAGVIPKDSLKTAAEGFQAAFEEVDVALSAAAMGIPQGSAR